MTAPTLPEIKAALVGIVEGVTGFQTVLSYEPQAIQTPPMATVTVVSYTRATAGQLVAMRWRIRARLYIKWQENSSAEAEADALCEAVADAVDSDPQFGGVISSGLAQSPDGTSGYIKVGDALVRIWDVFVDVLSKKAYPGGR